VSIEDHSDRRARPLHAPRGLDICSEQAAIPVEGAVELDGEAGAIVLHESELFLGVDGRAVRPCATLNGRFEQIESGAQALQGWLKKINVHDVAASCALMFTLRLN
jgi:hypothetical protein